MSNNEENYFEQGREDCKKYYESQAFAGLTRNVVPEQAIKLFWPPVEEQLVQMVMPMPKPRQKWIAGFRKEQTEMFAKLEVNQSKEK